MKSNNLIIENLLYFFLLSRAGNTIVTGGVPPKTYIEYIFTCFTMFLTCGFFGFVIGSISRVLDEKFQQVREFTQAQTTMNKFMKKKKISEDIRVEVREYMENLYIQEQEAQTDQENQLIGKLSQRLKMEIAKQANRRLLGSFKFLQNFSQQCQDEVIYMFEEFRYSPNETIFL